MVDIKERIRKVDLKTLDNSQLDSIGEVLGNKIGSICDKAAEEVNNIIKIYGLSAKIAVQLHDEKTGKRIKG